MEQLSGFQLMSNSIASHRLGIDEDLSLKGFLQEELASADKPLMA